MKRTLYLLAYLLPIMLLIVMVSLHYYTRYQAESLAENTPLPRFSVTNLSDTNKPFASADLTGQVVLLNIWASWCPPCRREHAILLGIARDYAVPLYGLNLREKPQVAKAFLEKFGNPFVMVGLDTTGDVAQLLGAPGVPQTFLIDKQGRIRYRHLGALTKNAWEEVIWPRVQQYMAEP